VLLEKPEWTTGSLVEGSLTMLADIFQVGYLSRGLGAGSAAPKLRSFMAQAGGIIATYGGDIMNEALASGSKTPVRDAWARIFIEIVSENISPDYKYFESAIRASKNPVIAAITKKEWNRVLGSRTTRYFGQVAKTTFVETGEELAAAGMRHVYGSVTGQNQSTSPGSMAEMALFGDKTPSLGETMIDEFKAVVAPMTITSALLGVGAFNVSRTEMNMAHVLASEINKGAVSIEDIEGLTATSRANLESLVKSSALVNQKYWYLPFDKRAKLSWLRKSKEQLVAESPTILTQAELAHRDQEISNIDADIDSIISEMDDGATTEAQPTEAATAAPGLLARVKRTVENAAYGLRALVGDKVSFVYGDTAEDVRAEADKLGITVTDQDLSAAGFIHENEDGTSTIFINGAVSASSVKNAKSPLHEALHPIMNAIQNRDKEKYNRIAEGAWKAINSSSPLAAAYGDWLDSGGYDESERTDEGLVDLLAFIADGQIDLSLLAQKGVKERLYDFVNMISEAIGLGRIAPNMPISEFRGVAKAMFDAFNYRGTEAAEELVGVDPDISTPDSPSQITPGGRGIRQMSSFKDSKAKEKGALVINSVNPSGTIFTEYNPSERASARLAENITTLDKTGGGKADDLVTVYRGVPSGENAINPGDFVTTDKRLAKDYAGGGNVVETQVKKGELLDDKTEPLGGEYIYRPKANADTKALP